MIVLRAFFFAASLAWLWGGILGLVLGGWLFPDADFAIFFGGLGGIAGYGLGLLVWRLFGHWLD
ncbi:hypothetical protein [Phaeobacter sp. S60]|uniref:hypothetical protein n=1 Tax=Phaeobacter sp. S60 TaxID=1569353 RepID=UPI001A7EB9FB|nr:hypothetical protein [Phaeobacter sp. S60]